MATDRFIDIFITDLEKNVKINFSQSSFSFTMNVGCLKKASFEDNTVLLLKFDKGEVRIEISLHEILQ